MIIVDSKDWMEALKQEEASMTIGDDGITRFISKSGEVMKMHWEIDDKTIEPVNYTLKQN